MMQSQSFTIFDEVTRLPVSRVTCDPSQIDRYIKKGQCAIPGRLDWSMRLAEDGTAVADQQQQLAKASERRREAALARIAELERKQHRRVRELLEDSDPQLKELSQQIAALRSELSMPPESDESSESVRPAAESPREA